MTPCYMIKEYKLMQKFVKEAMNIAFEWLTSGVPQTLNQAMHAKQGICGTDK